MRGRTLALTVALIAASAALAGCLGDDAGPAESNQTTPDDDAATNRTVPEQIGGLEHVAHLANDDAKDVEVVNGTAYVGAASGFFTVDLSDPESPEILGTVREVSSRYVALVEYEDRLVATASGLQQETLYLVNVTDPADPRLITSFDPGRTVHGTDAVPGTHLLYNPRGVGDAVEPGIDIIDVSDPANPEVLTRWSFPRTWQGQPVETPGCAMIWMQAGSEMAFCPGVSQTYLLDIADPENPELVSVISNPSIQVHHWVAPFDDQTRLFLADWAGAGNAQTCSGASGGGSDVSGSAGAVWVYDISDPQDPAPMGFTSAPPPQDLQDGQACVVHTIEGVPGHPVTAAAWHYGGVVLVDASDPMQPRVMDQWTNGTDVWAVDVWGPYVIAGQQNEGLDIFRLTSA